jgi:hypothetical protein
MHSESISREIPKRSDDIDISHEHHSVEGAIALHFHEETNQSYIRTWSMEHRVASVQVFNVRAVYLSPMYTLHVSQHGRTSHLAVPTSSTMECHDQMALA